MRWTIFSSFILVTLIARSETQLYTVSDPVIQSVNDLEPADSWQEYTTYEGIKVEYRMKRCGGEGMRDQNRVLLRFTNTTTNSVTFSWKTKIWRDEQCTNCDRIDRSENQFELTLDAGQTIEAQGTRREDPSLYIFDNFVKHVPGMTKTRLTNFEFVDMNVR